MNYYFMAIVLIAFVFIIVIAKLIFKIHELYVKIEELNERVIKVLDVVNDHVIVTNEIIKNIDEHLECQNRQLKSIERCIQNEIKDELNAIGKTTTEQADIMLNIEGKINELEIEQRDEKEGDAIESERIPAACIEN